MSFTGSASRRLLLWAAWLVLLVPTGPARATPLTLQPLPGGTVPERRPVISVSYLGDDRALAQSARLWVNGREVTAGCLRAPNFLSYQAPVPMPEGEVQVRFTARTSNAESLEEAWTFRIQARNRIQAVRHDATGELGQYDDLMVEMEAEPGGEAFFEIEGLREDLPMQEVSPGLYRGTCGVLPGDYRLQASVIGHLRTGSEVSSMSAARPVSIFGHLFRVRILEPANGSQVPLNFVLRGRTKPFSRISVTPKIGFDEGMSAPTRDDPSSETGSIPAEADAEGFFTVRYGFPLKLPNMHLAITVVATDHEGNRSIPAFLRLRF
jgi:hypothetical protein